MKYFKKVIGFLVIIHIIYPIFQTEIRVKLFLESTYIQSPILLSQLYLRHNR